MHVSCQCTDPTVPPPLSPPPPSSPGAPAPPCPRDLCDGGLSNDTQFSILGFVRWLYSQKPRPPGRGAFGACCLAPLMTKMGLGGFGPSGDRWCGVGEGVGSTSAECGCLGHRRTLHWAALAEIPPVWIPLLKSCLPQRWGVSTPAAGGLPPIDAALAADNLAPMFNVSPAVQALNAAALEALSCQAVAADHAGALTAREAGHRTGAWSSEGRQRQPHLQRCCGW